MRVIPNLQPAIDIIKPGEGCRLTAYRDTGGIWTIGYGHTIGVTRGMVITQAEAEELFVEDLHRFAVGVRSAIHSNVACNDNQFCAFVSFAYNVGLGAFMGSTMLRDFNEEMPNNVVAQQFGLWIHDHAHHIEPGLVRRRKQERDLFLT